MSEEPKESLETRVERIEALVKDNNHILHHMRMIQRLHYLWTGLRVGLILVGTGLVYYYAIPYFLQISSIYQDVQNSTQKINSLQKQIEPLSGFLKRFTP